jgi:hypothetical protein
MLHHAETKLFFCLMHMFELFEFDFGAFFILNPKEKNKRKGTRKFRIKEKGKVSTTPSLLGLLAHSTQLAARPRAHASADRWAPPVGAVSRARARTPLLSLASGTAPSAQLRARAHPLSLARRPCPSDSSPPPQPPRPWHAPRARLNRAHAHAPRLAHVARAPR